MMIQAGGLYTVGGLVMMLFLAACAAAGGKDAEGPVPSVRDRLAPEGVTATGNRRRIPEDDIPVAG